jgi:UDP-N-acetylglucosamine--N-acetylmuramyl-(pentapeptide) pyrophosphoryl-undecaprenol N-acetylglucosamine transferase
MNVVLAGGGSAGHIEPALAVADALRRADPQINIVCLGTERGLETRLVPLRGYELALIPPVPLPRRVTPELLGVPGRLGSSVSAVMDVLDRAGAEVLVGFGGYVATPGYLAARRRQVPIVVHEANARPGLANRIGARFTRYVFTGQPGTKLPHASYVGIPLRREIATLDRLALADKARAHFGLRPDLPVLLVTGGSQGARSLNYAVLDAAEWIRAAGIQVLHILGPRSDIDVRLPPGGPPYITLPYVDRMDLAYAAADFAICRSGAMTCAELTAVGLPACYVPLPHGNGEQRLNAVPIEAAGGGLIIPDADLSPQWIRSDLLPILVDAKLVAAMSQAAASMGHRDTDSRLAATVIALMHEVQARRAGHRRAAAARPGPRSAPTAGRPARAPDPYPGQPGPYQGEPGPNPGERGAYPAPPAAHPREQGPYPGEPGPYPGEPGGYPRPPVPPPGEQGRYPTSPGPYPGEPGPYPGEPGPYPGQPSPRPGEAGPYPGQPGPYGADPDPDGGWAEGSRSGGHGRRRA